MAIKREQGVSMPKAREVLRLELHCESDRRDIAVGCRLTRKRWTDT
ncbi:MAG: hypothetical protein GY866_04495 [Proteobacteria bacterium]|nr:hypothetical protein [Pseudomonadota bacterium]